ncbi:MAG TPA: UDP-N-acetylglucosamine--N-acetylmuramyl-(pentapeptide) pyrophosphoryl-undecaprenol N-acetylglucosamine transferase [Candidatus Babeliales bacterium]|nr:UDP-N-acetylglucosamine--N-acetylmuramyl-(pentapeptide) pyrophosphoryl-undecaprenol N-acetylglucosamine transferase [Candidatus Babeliales bacterium]
MTVVFAGGGTGGHVYPAIAIADALRARGATIAFIGTADRLEATIVPKAGYVLHPIASRSMPRTPSFGLLATITSNLKGTLQSLRLLAAQRPDLVIATGGYVAFPVALAARIRRFLRLSTAPLVLLEPNAAPGLTNRLLSPVVDEVWRAAPVRAELRDLPRREDAAARLGLDPSLRTLLAVGGSQGARSINDALMRLVENNAVPAGWQLLALTGQTEYDRVRPVLPLARPYLDDMRDAYAVADLVLARAGASTLGELAALRKPAILVPYPYASEDHQAANAARFEAAGAAVIVNDETLRDEGLAPVLEQTVQPQRLAQLCAGAARLEGADSLAVILARIEALTARKGAA